MLTLTALTMLLVPATATAHKLSDFRARTETRAYIVTHNVRDGVKGWEIGNCTRRSRHSISCPFALYNWQEQDVCNGRLRVSYRGRYSYFTRWSVIRDNC